MWHLVAPRKARKDIDRVDKRQRQRILTALELIQAEPYSGKKLDGHPSRYSLRVWPYRIVYELDKQQQVIVVIRIGHRQGIYK